MDVIDEKLEDYSTISKSSDGHCWSIPQDERRIRIRINDDMRLFKVPNGSGIEVTVSMGYSQGICGEMGMHVWNS